MNDQNVSENELLTVICTTYNHGNYIERCISGILEQETTFKYRVLIHDDCSTDNTTEIVKSLAKAHPEKITAIIQKENQYSKGIKPAEILSPLINSKYLAYCEGDDFWCDKNKLQIAVNFLETNKDFYCVFHNYKILEDRTGKITSRPLSSDIVLSPTEMKRNRIFCRTCTLVRRGTPLEPSSDPKYIGNNFIYETSKIKNGDLLRNSAMGYHGKGMYLGSYYGSVFRANEHSAWEFLPEVDKSQHRAVSRYWIARFHERMGDLDTAAYWASGALKNLQSGLQDIFDEQTRQTTPGS